MKRFPFLLALCLAFVVVSPVYGANVNVPSSVVDISKENTYPNPTPDIAQLSPSPLAAELLATSNEPIENPKLIKLLNETTMNKAPLAVGFKASIYLGHWPLAYKSEKTTMNWSFKRVNNNFYDNRTGDEAYRLKYVQRMQAIVRGGLTTKIEASDQVEAMMMNKALAAVNLPISFQTVVGENTKKENIYHVPMHQLGYLSAYVPAVNEKGKVTFGEVYLHIDGGKRTLVVENITSHGIGAWIPVQDHIHITFMSSRKPL
ncbi:MAG: YfkD family protein [Bacilli bacterium]